jgi:glycine dehydrogenase
MTASCLGVTGAPSAVSEAEATRELHEIAEANTPLPSMIGLAYHDTVTRTAIRRNVRRTRPWHTAYTPYRIGVAAGAALDSQSTPLHGD